MPPWTPPLKSTIGAFALNGTDSANSTSTSPSPEPTIASGQARSASAVVRASSLPFLQVGMPRAFTPDASCRNRCPGSGPPAGGCRRSSRSLRRCGRRSASGCASGTTGRRDAAVVSEEEVPGRHHVRPRERLPPLRAAPARPRRRSHATGGSRVSFPARSSPSRRRGQGPLFYVGDDRSPGSSNAGIGLRPALSDPPAARSLPARGRFRGRRRANSSRGRPTPRSRRCGWRRCGG